jgi:Short C-terminal domain
VLGEPASVCLARATPTPVAPLAARSSYPSENLADLTEVTSRFDAGDERGALKLFEKEVLAAKKHKDLERLREFEPFAEALLSRCIGREHKIAQRTLYVIKQNIALFAGGTWPPSTGSGDAVMAPVHPATLEPAAEAPSRKAPVPRLDYPGAHPRDFGNLNPKVQRALEENLARDETIQVIIRGAHGQAMIGTESRVFVCKPGWMDGAAFGAETTSWSYRNLVGVQVHKGLMSGAVVLQAPGQTGKKTSYWGNKDDDPAKAPNAIPVVGAWSEVQAGVVRLRQLVDQAHAPVSAAPPATQAQPSKADELRKLADLHGDGILTDEEFRHAKSRLLEQ